MPLAMVLVLVSKPHAQALTAIHNHKVWGCSRDAIFTQGQHADWLSRSARASRGLPGGLGTLCWGHYLGIQPRGGASALGGGQGQVGTVSMQGLWDVQGPQCEMRG